MTAEKKMSKKLALQILIQSASRDIKGGGLGFRSTTDEWREIVSNAIRKLYSDAYGIPISESVEFNLGLHY